MGKSLLIGEICGKPILSTENIVVDKFVSSTLKSILTL